MRSWAYIVASRPPAASGPRTVMAPACLATRQPPLSQNPAYAPAHPWTEEAAPPLKKKEEIQPFQQKITIFLHHTALGCVNYKKSWKSKKA